MKEITFRPLRRIKKTGKLCVASYMQWRKIKVADYAKFRLVISDEYKSFQKDEYIYNHEGKQLFWRNYNPEEIPLLTGLESLDGESPYAGQWLTLWGMYSARGLDCDGVPTFSHHTADEIYNSKADMTDFEPLTVETVVWWFGWFLYQLNNNELNYKKY